MITTASRTRRRALLFARAHRTDRCRFIRASMSSKKGNKRVVVDDDDDEGGSDYDEASPSPAKKGKPAKAPRKGVAKATPTKGKAPKAETFELKDTQLDPELLVRCRLNTSGRPRVLKARLLVFDHLESTSLSKRLVSNELNLLRPPLRRGQVRQDEEPRPQGLSQGWCFFH